MGIFTKIFIWPFLCIPRVVLFTITYFSHSTTKNSLKYQIWNFTFWVDKMSQNRAIFFFLKLPYSVFDCSTQPLILFYFFLVLQCCWNIITMVKANLKLRIFTWTTYFSKCKTVNFASSIQHNPALFNNKKKKKKKKCLGKSIYQGVRQEFRQACPIS